MSIFSNSSTASQVQKALDTQASQLAKTLEQAEASQLALERAISSGGDGGKELEALTAIRSKARALEAIVDTLRGDLADAILREEQAAKAAALAAWKARSRKSADSIRKQLTDAANAIETARKLLDLANEAADAIRDSAPDGVDARTQAPHDVARVLVAMLRPDAEMVGFSPASARDEIGAYVDGLLRQIGE
ncbi:MAG TPA: hypothetical protein DCG47_13580 [Spirochaetaceae bacterium]|nr:hypothetical protein [Spirochaetaceae bacterium]